MKSVVRSNFILASVLSFALLAVVAPSSSIAKPSKNAKNLKKAKAAKKPAKKTTNAAQSPSDLAASAGAKVVTSPPVAGETNGSVSVTTVETNVDTEDQKLTAILKFVFDNEAAKHGWPANYTTLWCPSNIFNLIRRLDQAGVDLSKANVWYILPKASVKQIGETVVHPKMARGGPTEWAFHVVLEIQGRVLDLDFTDHPHVVTTAEYGSLMWQKGPSAALTDKQILFARVIPARDYLSSYAGNWTWYVSGGGGRYAPTDFDSLLQ